MKHLTVNIEQIFSENQGVLRTSELKQLGINEHILYRYYKNGLIQRIKKGIYKWTNSEENEWVEAQKIVPQGIFCLYSAAYLHRLTTFVPFHFQMTLPNSKAPYTSPEIHFFHWENYELGISKYQIENYQIRVYCAEKTVCDMLRFKNKVGWDIAKEVLKTYLDRKNRNISLLLEYAEHLKIKGQLLQYLDILL